MPERYYFVLNYPANPVRLAGASNCIPAWIGLLPSPAPSIFYSAPNGFFFGLSFPVLFAAFKSKAKSRPFFTSIPQPKQVGLVFQTAFTSGFTGWLGVVFLHSVFGSHPLCMESTLHKFPNVPLRYVPWVYGF
jgi:hypothetical protein